MIIPSIDIRGGRVVQLRQGKDLVLTDERSPEELARYFARFGALAVIDLDAALGTGDNFALIKRLCRYGRVRVGGGVRDEKRARELLRAGADRVIIGTAATPDLLQKLPADRVMVALDAKGDEVVDRGWVHGTGESVRDRAARLAPHCGSFLCTLVHNEGTMSGLDLERTRELVQSLGRPVTVAGGVKDAADVIAADGLGADVQVGMAWYTGQLDFEACTADLLNLTDDSRVPTVVQDESGQVLMLAYSNRASLTRALREGKGVYFSRSRNELWEKGATSGDTQDLLEMRVDCDRDTFLFRVRQHGDGACHRKTYSCFGDGRRDFTLQMLEDVLAKRKADRPEGSFSVKLFDDRELLLRKVIEEAFEVTRARNHDEFVWEIGDSIFFLLTTAVSEGVPLADVLRELQGRVR
ncbi:MAG: phosphoribosyl-ATP diphosphatase [Planctomycetota bacterium]